jgi:hypothetical protein
MKSFSNFSAKFVTLRPIIVCLLFLLMENRYNNNNNNNNNIVRSVCVVVDASAPPPLWWHRKKRVNVTGLPNVANGWADSYSYKGTHCYCESSFDHNIGPVKVTTPLGVLSVKQICDLLGPGPGSTGRPKYNDIQCGNGPPNDAGDEIPCPGRVDHGQRGCRSIGPKWNFTGITLTQALIIVQPKQLQQISSSNCTNQQTRK